MCDKKTGLAFIVKITCLAKCILYYYYNIITTTDAAMPNVKKEPTDYSDGRLARLNTES